MFDVPEEPPETPVTAPVTVPPPPTLPVPQTVALPAEFDQISLAHLARRLAHNIETRDEVLKSFGLTPEQFEAIKQIGFFQRVLEQEIIAWASTTATPDRVKLEAAAMFERFLPHLHKRMIDKRENMNYVVDGAKLLAKVAGIGEQDPRGSSTPGERFTININLGGDAKLERTVSPSPRTIEGSAIKISTDS